MRWNYDSKARGHPGVKPLLAFVAWNRKYNLGKKHQNEKHQHRGYQTDYKFNNKHPIIEYIASSSIQSHRYRAQSIGSIGLKVDFT